MSAEADYRRAQDFLSRTPPQYRKALSLLRQAADGGHARAAFQLAGCLIGGTGTIQNQAEGVRYLRLAASLGHDYARFNCLQIQESRGVAAVKLLTDYKDLAEAGFVGAQWRLAQIFYESGDDGQAVEWAQAAAAQNHPRAQYFLARRCQSDEKPDFERAHALYLLAASGGLVAAHWQLGLQYRYGQGVAADKCKAEEHFRFAAEGHLAQAQAALAELLLEKGDAEAVKWFQTASAHGEHHADAVLAELYLTGRHTVRNYPQAFSHAQAAARCGHPQGLRLLGDIYRYGLGVAADRKKAAAFYRRAAAAGSVQAQQKLLSHNALEGAGGFECLKAELMQSQEAGLLFRQAEAAYHGLNTVADIPEAVRLYRRAAEKGHRGAQTSLGKFYAAGRYMPQNTAEAVRWFERAAGQHEPEAQYCLACLYFHGRGVARNRAAACRYLRGAISDGHGQRQALEEMLKHWERLETDKKAV